MKLQCLLLNILKKKKQGKVTGDADSIFGHVANNLQAMDVRSKEYVKFNIQEILFQCSFGVQSPKEHLTPVSHLSHLRPITPLGSACSAGAASIHQNPMLTQNQRFQMDAKNIISNSNIPNILVQCITMTSVFRGK